MDFKFWEDIIKLFVDKVFIGILILLIGYVITKAIEKFKSEQAILKEYETMRDKTALQHLQRQIEELYSPLLGLIQQSRIVYEVEQKKLPLKSTPEEFSKTKDYFIEKYYLPLNDEMAKLIRTKIYLLDTDEMPESFHQFLKHESQFAALYKLWKDKGIRSDEIDGEEYPLPLENDVKNSLNELRKRYNHYLKRLEIGSEKA